MTNSKKANFQADAAKSVNEKSFNSKTPLPELVVKSENRLKIDFPDLDLSNLDYSTAEKMMQENLKGYSESKLIDLSVDLSRIVVHNLDSKPDEKSRISREYLENVRTNITSNQLESLSKDSIAVELFKGSFLAYSFEELSPESVIGFDYWQIMKGLSREDNSVIEPNLAQILSEFKKI